MAESGFSDNKQQNTRERRIINVNIIEIQIQYATNLLPLSENLIRQNTKTRHKSCH